MRTKRGYNRGYSDLYERIERLWCKIAHRDMWKLSDPVYFSRGQWWFTYRCRRCGEEHTYPKRDREGEKSW